MAIISILQSIAHIYFCKFIVNVLKRSVYRCFKVRSFLSHDIKDNKC